MPPSMYARYSLDDLSALADRKVILSGELRISELPRLGVLLATDRDCPPIRINLSFCRDPSGFVGLELTYEARLEVSCQRCLEPIEQTLCGELAWTVIERDSQAAAVSRDREIYELAGDTFQAAAFVEEELIVSLPMIPRHASIDDCGALAQNLVALSPGQEPKPERPPLEGHRGE